MGMILAAATLGVPGFGPADSECGCLARDGYSTVVAEWSPPTMR